MEELYNNFEYSVYNEILNEFQHIFKKNYHKNKTYIKNFLNKYFKLLLNQESYLYKPIIQLIRYLEKNKHQLPQSITSSSGSSFVILTDTLVFQYYKEHIIKKNIYNIYQKIIDNHLFKYNDIEYNLLNYIVPINIMLSNNHIIMNNVIIWTKIKPVNLIKDNPNIDNMKRDINIALNGLHQKGIIHGDTRIDNIGFYNDRYILFDFDMSKILLTDNYELKCKDFITFETSLKFNLYINDYIKKN
jgi:tRNA A-37 threonylcarbamoyl transferase component Bud32